MEKRKVFGAWKWFLLIMLAVCMFQVKPVKAAGFTRLGLNRTYTAYDVTGDGRRDRIRIATTRRGEYFKQVRVIINGKNRLVKNFTTSMSWPTSVRFRICTLSNRKPFLFLECMGDSSVENTACLYQYSGGKLKTVLNMRRMLSSTYIYKSYFDVKKVSGNTITFKVSGMPFNTGFINWDMSYRYQRGRFVRTSTTSRLQIKTYTVIRRFQTYKKAGSRQKAFVAQIGQKVKLTHICIKNKVPYFRVMDSKGRVGWMKGATMAMYTRVSHYSAPNKFYGYYFKEGIVAG